MSNVKRFDLNQKNFHKREYFLESPLEGFVLNLEEASTTSTLAIIVSLLFLIGVGLDKKIKFRKVIGIEHMLRMKNFSNSEMHYKLSICLPIIFIGLIVSIFKHIYYFSDIASYEKPLVSLFFSLLSSYDRQAVSQLACWLGTPVFQFLKIFWNSDRK